MGATYINSVVPVDRAVLVERFQSGEFDAFDEIVNGCRGRVYNLAYRFTHNAEDACDISQEVFIKVFRSLGRLKDASAFDAWLRRVTMNACMDHLRRRPNEQNMEYSNLIMSLSQYISPLSHNTSCSGRTCTSTHCGSF